MVTSGLVHRHLVSECGIEVDRAKIELISQLPIPKTVKDIRSFLGHAGLYRCFIQDFSSIPKPFCTLLQNDTTFVWTDECQHAFETLKEHLTVAPIQQTPRWDLPFEIMTDTSDFALGAVLSQRVDNKALVIYYASQFDITIRDKKGVENVLADHLSRLQLPDVSSSIPPLNENFPDEHLFAVSRTPWFMDIVNYLVTDPMPEHWTTQNKHKFLAEVQFYYFNAPYLFMYCADQLVHRCIPDDEFTSVFHFCLTGAYRVHFATKKTVTKISKVDSTGLLFLKMWSLFTRTAFKTNLVMSPYTSVYGRACHLLVEIQYHALWAIKQINFSLDAAKGLRKLQISELDEVRREAYDNSHLAKERMKALHDKYPVPDQKVLIYNSRLNLFPKKLKSRWSGSYIVKEVHPHGEVDIVNPKNGNNFIVNGQRLKPFMTAFDPNEEILLV
ncbi:uncharacterized protein LOC122316196 [Carya illinoinensis]|uniref:uncharacterized protein LOC122316196 n=1 Tax=Carya illinoinensis TaxID=32201 RepID=UPI001C71F896|nr:uncharacterized protein LOC122316196 [Carya illinoinensis]